MRRLPIFAFAALVAATVAAFFITQHLKVTTPLIAGAPRPAPEVINPLSGKRCSGVDHRVMHISFYLLRRSDVVDEGQPVAPRPVAGPASRAAGCRPAPAHPASSGRVAASRHGVPPIWFEAAWSA